MHVFWRQNRRGWGRRTGRQKAHAGKLGNGGKDLERGDQSSPLNMLTPLKRVVSMP